MPTSNNNAQNGQGSHLATGSDAKAARKARRSATPRDASAAARGTRRGRRAAAQQVKGASHMSERTARATKRAAAAHKRRAAGAKPATKRPAPLVPIATIVAVLAVAAVVGIGFLVVPHLFQRNQPEVVEEYPSGELVIVTVPEGAGGSQIAQLLMENHVISNESTFYQEIQKQNADASMKSGTYQFITGATPSEVVRQLVSGPNATEFQLKLAEGLTVTQTAAAVESQLGIPADDFIAQAKASNYVDEYPFLDNVGDDSLEGYLFAKTYDFGGTDMTADTVIRTMLNQYQTEVGALDMQTARDTLRERYNIDISDYGVLRVASIVEREATTDEDRPLIASVFYNRLSIGMALQSDATMMYVTGGNVTAADLQTESPYNTYLNAGLTPTPICSPSIESIQAAMEPSDTKYLYFFINDKVHQFSETYEDHQQAISEAVNS